MDREKAILMENAKVIRELTLAIEALREELQLSGETSTISEETSTNEGDAESATTTDCNDCIWNTCNYNKINWEASEDCISRQQAIEVLAHVKEDEQWRTECIDNEIRLIESLPPVTPTERTGEWIVYSLVDEGRVELECPECGDTFVRAVDYRPHFCENCGADMRGDKE